MKRERGTKSRVQYIVDALMTGGKLKSGRISEMVSEKSGLDIRPQDVASMMTRLTDPARTNLGFFIIKEPDGKGFTYRLAEELFELPVEKIYGLCVKTGPDAFSLAQAVDAVPELNGYIEKAGGLPESKLRRRRSKKIRQG